jgi:hypothetical protein
MNPLQRSSLNIEIDEVLAIRDSTPSVLAGHDPTGGLYLAVRAHHDAQTETWMCAPISRLALHCVTEGRAAPVDALRHSVSGIVHRIIVSTDDLSSVTESVQLCRELADEDLVGADNSRVPRWLSAARCA